MLERKRKKKFPIEKIRHRLEKVIGQGALELERSFEVLELYEDRLGAIHHPHHRARREGFDDTRHGGGGSGDGRGIIF